MLDGKPRLVVSARYPPMGADEIRWLYCRQNPAANINFGPEPAEEIRNKFFVKLWNSYAFFCELARQPGDEGFDPNLPAVPLKDRPDTDRWILADLQGLVKTARTAFENYSVSSFCLAAEAFVEDKLSNWYVRTQKDRFWAKGRNANKQAAFQTLYTVLTTLAKLCAPVIPFLTEAMHQNLASLPRKRGEESIHLCDYPTADESLTDAQLSQDMDALLRLVSLGRAVRNVAKIKVRQALAELKVLPGDDRERRAIERFSTAAARELNVKKVTVHLPDPHDTSTWWLLEPTVKPNHQRLKEKFGQRMGEVLAQLRGKIDMVAQQPGAPLTTEVRLDNEYHGLDQEDFLVWQAPSGFAGLADRGTQLLLDARITPELAREGMGREVIRHVQSSRKEAKLNMEDRIELYLGADGKLAEAIAEHREYIGGETLVSRWSDKPLGNGAFHAEVKVEGQSLVIELRKIFV
jgi:isoleucyl-tRNA synthetase